jgi:REP element-mobilizing transposase RayT
MTMRKESFEVGNWYHCFNRSIEGRSSFVDSRDYYRFLELLSLANDELPLRRDDIGVRSLEEILALPRGKRLVSIAAFNLMPDHFHLVLKEIVDGGITTFMRKLGTAYTLYFNSRHNRRGNLFLKPFQSLRTSPDHRLQHLISYVHCNPATLIDPKWKHGPVADPQFLGEQVAGYPYSSLSAHTGVPTQLSPILGSEMLSLARSVPIQKMLQEARRYATDYNIP